jgi:hypothetical protein
LIGKLTM